MKKIDPKIRMFLVVAVFLGFFCRVEVSKSAPSISGVSGTIDQGQSIVVDGSAFGLKISGQSAPVRYDDFEEGTTVGHLIADDLTWWSRQVLPTQVASIADENCRSGKCGKFTVSTNSSNQPLRADSIFRNGVGFDATRKAYLNFWQYLDLVGNAAGSAASYQIKYVEMKRSPADGSVNYPDWQFSHWAYGTPPNPGWYNRSYFGDYLAANQSHITNVANDVFKTAGWYQISVQIDFGDINTANGKITAYVSRPDLASAYYKVSEDNFKTVNEAAPEGYTDFPDHIRLGWYHGSWFPGNSDTFISTLYYDNIYIDNSWARVEIGDQPTYDASTHREIQIPSVWSDGSVTVAVNRGSFNDGLAYLYVVDENGDMNAEGFPITIGSQQDVVSPAAPSELAVN